MLVLPYIVEFSENPFRFLVSQAYLFRTIKTALSLAPRELGADVCCTRKDTTKQVLKQSQAQKNGKHDAKLKRGHYGRQLVRPERRFNAVQVPRSLQDPAETCNFLHGLLYTYTCMYMYTKMLYLSYYKGSQKGYCTGYDDSSAKFRYGFYQGYFQRSYKGDS